MERLNEQETQFSTKPQLNENLRQQRPVNLVSNCFKILVKPNDEFVRQYAIKFEPEIPSDNTEKKNRILRSIRRDPKVNRAYGRYLFLGDSIFATKNVEEPLEVEYEERKESSDSDSNSNSSRSENIEIIKYRIIIQKTDNVIDLPNTKTISRLTIKQKSLVEHILKSIYKANPGMVQFDRSSVFDYNQAKHLDERCNYKFTKIYKFFNQNFRAKIFFFSFIFILILIFIFTFKKTNCIFEKKLYFETLKL